LFYFVVHYAYVSCMSLFTKLYISEYWQTLSLGCHIHNGEYEFTARIGLVGHSRTHRKYRETGAHTSSRRETPSSSSSSSSSSSFTTVPSSLLGLVGLVGLIGLAELGLSLLLRLGLVGLALWG